MKKIIRSCLSAILQNEKKPVSISEQNKLLLQRDLEKCYTIEDIKLLQLVCKLSVRDFTLSEFIEFNIDVNYRLELIKICNEKHSGNIYCTATIYKLFKSSMSISECRALLLHIEQNAKFYRTDLSIYYRLSNKRIEEIINELYEQAA